MSQYHKGGKRCINAFEDLRMKSSGDQFLSFSQVSLKKPNKTLSFLYIFIFKELFFRSSIL